MYKPLLITLTLCLTAPASWASETVFSNGKAVNHRGLSGKSIAAFPDVIRQPPAQPVAPSGIPIPYPNQWSDTSRGTNKVKVDGESVRLKNKPYYFPTVPGKPEPSPRASKPSKPASPVHVHPGKLYFQEYSFDVKFEDK